MKIIKFIPLFVLIFALLVSFFQLRDKLPEDAQSLVETYMDAYMNGTKESARYAHFENEVIKDAYLNGATYLIDYRIESTKRINDKLYALTVLVKTNHTGDAYMRVYNFVALINEQWYFINGVGNIPEELQDNLDKSQYLYKGE